MVILTILGLLSGIQVNPVNHVPFVFEVTLLTFFVPFVFEVTLLTFFLFFFSAHTRPHVIDEQEEFIRRVLEIPLEERKCRDLITLDTIHLYCGGPEPSAESRKLVDFSR